MMLIDPSLTMRISADDLLEADGDDRVESFIGRMRAIAAGGVQYSPGLDACDGSLDRIAELVDLGVNSFSQSRSASVGGILDWGEPGVADLAFVAHPQGGVHRDECAGIFERARGLA